MRVPHVFPLGASQFLGRTGEGDLLYWDQAIRHARVLSLEPLSGRPRILFAHRTSHLVLMVIEENNVRELVRVELRGGTWTRREIKAGGRASAA